MACRLGAAPSKVGFGVRPAQAGARHTFENLSGHRDVRPDPGVGNAELYCLSYDRKTKKNRHLQIYSGRRFSLAVVQNFRSSASLK